MPSPDDPAPRAVPGDPGQLAAAGQEQAPAPLITIWHPRADAPEPEPPEPS